MKYIQLNTIKESDYHPYSFEISLDEETFNYFNLNPKYFKTINKEYFHIKNQKKHKILNILAIFTRKNLYKNIDF